ncbi:ribbon-helix-helix protein, CopG family [Candidatus Bipolaricaulota bacterium]
MARRKRDPLNPLVMKNFMAPARLLAQLQELSDKLDISESEIIRRALEQHIADAKNDV